MVPSDKLSRHFIISWLFVFFTGVSFFLLPCAGCFLVFEHYFAASSIFGHQKSSFFLEFHWIYASEKKVVKDDSILFIHGKTTFYLDSVKERGNTELGFGFLCHFHGIIFVLNGQFSGRRTIKITYLQITWSHRLMMMNLFISHKITWFVFLYTNRIILTNLSNFYD